MSLNGHVFSADGSKGKWSRSGDTWTFKTKQGAKGDRFTLGLDFASDTWSFDGSSKTLDEQVHGADRKVLQVLNVQGLYEFGAWVNHEVNASWSHIERKTDWPPYGVHEIDGAYNSQTGVGSLKLKGHFPKAADTFGDVQIQINGASMAVPLLAASGFAKAFQDGKNFSYQVAGLSFDVNFGKGTWEAAVTGDKFTSDMAPKKGRVRVRVLVGGSAISDQTFVIQKSTTGLSYSG